MASDKVLQLSDETFAEEVLSGGDKPVLVDFYADWCGPCRALAPAIEKLAEEVGDAARVAKLNVDQSRATAARYRISSIPAVLVFAGGEVVENLVGIQPIERYRQALSAAAAV